MGMSEPELASLVVGAVLLNGLGLLAWRQGLVGRWFPWALGFSLLAVMVDPLQFPGVSAAGCLAALALALVGPAAFLRRRANHKVQPTQ